MRPEKNSLGNLRIKVHMMVIVSSTPGQILATER